MGFPNRNRQWALALLLCCALAGTASSVWAAAGKKAAKPNKRHEQKTVQSLEAQWRQALLDGDAGSLAPMLADDFLGVSASGVLTDKQQYLKRISGGRYKFTKIDVQDAKIRVHNDTAIVVTLAEIDALLEGAPMQGTYRYTRVYRLYPGGTWKLINFEATRVSPTEGLGSELKNGVPMKTPPPPKTTN
jgi:ketosteroid isomerase-like protein